MTTPDSWAVDSDIKEYLIWLALERGRSPNTLQAYERDLRRYQDHLSKKRPLHATAEDVIAFVVALRGLAPASVARTLVAVRGLHRYLTAEEIRPDDPTANIEMPRVPRGLPKALHVEQVTALIESVDGSAAVDRRDRAALEFLYGTGARISETVGLSIGDIDLHDGLVRLMGKGSKERIVPIGRHAADALRRWLDPQGRAAFVPRQWARRSDAEAVFLNQRGGRLTRQGMWGKIRQRASTVGLRHELTPHVLRHSCATHMLDHGADIRSVQELLGHASISTTQIYTEVSTRRLMQVYRAAHPRATVDSGGSSRSPRRP